MQEESSQQPYQVQVVGPMNNQEENCNILSDGNPEDASTSEIEWEKLMIPLPLPISMSCTTFWQNP